MAADSLSGSDSKTSAQAVWSLVLGILSITCLWILGSIPAIILGILAIKSIDRSAGLLQGRGLAIGGIATGGAGLVLGIVPLAMVAAMVLPATTKVQERAWEAKQMSDIRQLVLGCQQWAGDHDGNFPPDLQALVPDYLAEDVLTWESRAGESFPFRYQPGLTESSDPDAVLIAGPEPFGDVRVVGRVSGVVESVPEIDYEGP